MKPEYYVYLHSTPGDDGTIFYIGMGKGQRAWNWSGRTQAWYQIAAREGLRVIVPSVRMLKHEARDFEKRLIQTFGNAGFGLVNVQHNRR